MPSNDLFGDRNKAPVWTIGTPDPGLLTDAPHPFVFASRRITGLSGTLALEPDRENVRSPAKQRPEQLDLRFWRRILSDQLAVLIRCRGLLARSTLRSGNLNGHIVMLSTKPQGVHCAVARKCGKKRCAKILRRGQSLRTRHSSFSPELGSLRIQSLKQFRIYNPLLQGDEPRIFPLNRLDLTRKLFPPLLVERQGTQIFKMLTASS